MRDPEILESILNGVQAVLCGAAVSVWIYALLRWKGLL